MMRWFGVGGVRVLAAYWGERAERWGLLGLCWFRILHVSCILSSVCATACGVGRVGVSVYE